MKEKYLKIINHFGEKNQLKKLHEEVYEYTESILLDDGSIESKLHILEELSDVMNLLNQFKVCYEITDEELNKALEYKVERTLNRINENYYNKGE